MKTKKIVFLFLILALMGSSLFAIEKGQTFISTRLSSIKLIGDGPGSQIKAWGGFGIGHYFTNKLAVGLDGEVGWTRPWNQTTQNYITYLIPITLSVRYNFIEKKFTPFATAGIGMLYWDLRNALNDTEDHGLFERYGYAVYGAMQRDAVASIGAGVHYQVAKHFGIDLFTRYHHILEQNMDMSGLDEYYKGILEAGLSFNVYFGKSKPKDSDGDGIIDKLDKAPKHAEDMDGFQDDDGIPDPDNDNDGILDVDDKAPNKAEDKDGFQDDDGIPDFDNDKDGIPDVKDRCPNKPETFNGYKDKDGCPDIKPVVKPVAKPVVKPVPKPAPKPRPVIYKLKNITFEFNSFNLTTTAKTELNKFIASIKEYPKAKLAIRGYTDSIGAKAYNIMLSKKRAEAVREYFIKHGIEAFRLTAKGFGPENPVASNKTKTGRAQNRRIEIKIVK